MVSVGELGNSLVMSEIIIKGHNNHFEQRSNLHDTECMYIVRMLILFELCI